MVMYPCANWTTFIVQKHKTCSTGLRSTAHRGVIEQMKERMTGSNGIKENKAVNQRIKQFSARLRVATF